MAKQYGKDSAVDFAPANLMSFGKSFATLNGQPLSKSEVWYDKAALDAFALTDAAYVGQEVAYVDVDNNKVTRYVIQLDGTLKEGGSSVIGDEKSIVVAEDGTVSLYGVEGLTLERTDDEGKVTKINYQPLLVDGKLTWVEPSATTVEGLATEIEGIKSRLATLEGEGEGSVKKIAEAAADARVNKFATDISDDGTVNTFKELVDYVADHGTEAADMAADILALQGLVGETAVATQIVEKIDEALKVDGVDKYALATELAAAVERIAANETAIADIDAEVIKTVKVNGTALTVSDNGVDIPVATALALGLVKSTDAENGVSVAADGTMSVNSININKLVQTDGDMLILDGGRVSVN